ncbi:DUF397 domain-containing protein [Streptomyces sp. NPDC005576]|uniref:DUF397 domain-containing protein n=1 Tax=unclassified Streptomyces TaxID=2593676 RepID=UPI003411E472
MSMPASAEGAPGLTWFKSSYSTNDGPDCAEVAAAASAVLVRDSKNTPGPQLGFQPPAWAAFVGFAAGR